MNEECGMVWVNPDHNSKKCCITLAQFGPHVEEKAIVTVLSCRLPLRPQADPFAGAGLETLNGFCSDDFGPNGCDLENPMDFMVKIAKHEWVEKGLNRHLCMASFVTNLFDF